MKPSEVKTKINELNNYFINKMKKNQFKVVEVEEYTMKVIIDNYYVFNLWVANGDFSLALYGDFKTKETNPVNVYFNETNKQKVWEILKKHIDKNYKEVVLKEKQKQLEALKIELGV